MRLLHRACVSVLALAGLISVSPAYAADPAHGAQLVGLAGCHSCHTAKGSPDFAGGYAIVTDFGTFYGPNITPDPKHGIGGWTLADFTRALREGIAPDGHYYYPSFPYTSFTALSDADIADIWAYLQTVAPAAKPDVPHEIKYIYRGNLRLGLWRKMAWDPTLPAQDIAKYSDPAIKRGAYLAIAVGHCTECHSPRTRIGAIDRERLFAGTDAPPQKAPNITQSASGIGSWSLNDLQTFLRLGMKPNGDFVGGDMMGIIENGTAKLSAADRAALAQWLKAIPPVD